DCPENPSNPPESAIDLDARRPFTEDLVAGVDVKNNRHYPGQTVTNFEDRLALTSIDSSGL
ncbi:hypothetical protein BGZ54_008186, partial [Gamsiella multidivaricata]